MGARDGSATAGMPRPQCNGRSASRLERADMVAGEIGLAPICDSDSIGSTSVGSQQLSRCDSSGQLTARVVLDGQAKLPLGLQIFNHGMTHVITAHVICFFLLMIDARRTFRESAAAVDIWQICMRSEDKEEGEHSLQDVRATRVTRERRHRRTQQRGMTAQSEGSRVHGASRRRRPMATTPT